MFGSKRMWRFTIPAAVFTLLFLAATDSNISLAGPLVRVKDISRIKGMRPNQLVGRGLIVGLNGTGDKEAIAFGMIANMLRHNGLEIDKDKVKLKNVAAVMVTCTIPPFAKEGDQLNVSVSSLADAKSLKGGTLIQTPLLGADGKIYAVAQGSISLGGGETQGGGGAVHTLVGLIPRGAVVEREIPMSYSEGNEVSLILREKDFTTASRLARSINKHFPGEMAKAIDPGQVKVSVPFSYRNQVVDFISALEDLYLEPDNIARVVINERTGTVVIGSEVRISRVAITHGNLSVQIQQRTGNVVDFPESANVKDVVDAMNEVGASARDIISVLQAMKSAGAIHAELEIL